MKKFEEAELEVMTFDSNVIATSGGANDCPNYCPTAQKIECKSDCDNDCKRDFCISDSPICGIT